MFKVNNKDTRNFEHISHFVLVFIVNFEHVIADWD